MMGRYFDIERDKKFPYFCEACLVGKTEDEMSEKDIRYCNSCQQVIEESYALEAETRSRPNRYKLQKQTEKVAPMEMDTAKDKEVLVHTKTESTHAYQNPTQTPIINLGGRPRKDIPVELIHKLSKQDLSIKSIVRELKGKGYTIGTTTISRVLSGKRNKE